MITELKLNYKDLGYYTTDESNMFILISLLHANHLINNDSLKTQFKRLKEGKLYRRVNTYYSKINDRWYNDESIFEVYTDILDSMQNPKSPKVRLKLERLNKLRKINGLQPIVFKTHLNFEEILKYLNKYLNKNRNYCIDHLFHEFIKPIAKRYEYNSIAVKNMFDFDFYSIEQSYKHNYYDYDDYCCEYCCGEYNDWLDSKHERRDYEIKIKMLESISEKVTEFLNTKREKYKGSYKKFIINE